MRIRSFCLALALALSAICTPRPRGCDINNAIMVLPHGQTQLVLPKTPPSFILLGVGVQNYTCSAAGTYTGFGAVAELFDISCSSATDFFEVQDKAYRLWSKARAGTTEVQAIGCLRLPDVGQHYFFPTASGISPKWDFTSTGPFANNIDAYVVAAKAGGIPAPTGAKDVDWLVLNSTEGKLASQVFRVDTRGGPPPSSCTPGSPMISVKYTTKYWLYGASL